MCARTSMCTYIHVHIHPCAHQACLGWCPLSRASDRRQAGQGQRGSCPDCRLSLVWDCVQTGGAGLSLPVTPSLQWPWQSRKQVVSVSTSAGRDLAKESSSPRSDGLCRKAAGSHSRPGADRRVCHLSQGKSPPACQVRFLVRGGASPGELVHGAVRGCRENFLQTCSGLRCQQKP